LPFTSLEQFLQRSDYQIHVINTTALYSELQEASDPVLKQLYERLSFTKDLPLISLAGLQKVCNQDKFAFVTSTLIAAVMIKNLTCLVEAVPGTLMKEYLALALAKNSPFRGIINHNLLILQQSGILKRLHEKTWPQVIIPEVSWRSVDAMDLASLAALLCFGTILSLLVLVVEFFWKNIQ
ncbi:hypothetical protein C0J52_03833, partial [Blattella germanica]